MVISNPHQKWTQHLDLALDALDGHGGTLLEWPLHELFKLCSTPDIPDAPDYEDFCWEVFDRVVAGHLFVSYRLYAIKNPNQVIHEFSEPEDLPHSVYDPTIDKTILVDTMDIFAFIYR